MVEGVPRGPGAESRLSGVGVAIAQAAGTWQRAPLKRAAKHTKYKEKRDDTKTATRREGAETKRPKETSEKCY